MDSWGQFITAYRCNIEKDKFVPPVDQWKDHEFELFHSKKSNSRYFSRNGDNRGRGRGRGNRNRGGRGNKNKNKEKDYYNAGGDAKNETKRNDQETTQSESKKSWKNDLQGLDISNY